MLTDIEIAQKNKMDKITDVAQKIGLTSDDLELYGDYKAKISFSKLKELQQKKDGGKTTVFFRLYFSLNRVDEYS